MGRRYLEKINESDDQNIGERGAFYCYTSFILSYQPKERQHHHGILKQLHYAFSLILRIAYCASPS